MGFFTTSNDKIFRFEEKNIWSEITIHSSRFANDLFIDALGRQFKVLRIQEIKTDYKSLDFFLRVNTVIHCEFSLIRENITKSELKEIVLDRIHVFKSYYENICAPENQLIEDYMLEIDEEFKGKE